MSRREKGNRPITLQERLEIMKRAERKENDVQIAASMNLSRAVVRKWRRKTKDRGVDGLLSVMGRPRMAVLGQFSEELRDEIKEKRKSHPGWGASVLRAEVANDKKFAGLRIPSCSRIAAYLKKEGLTRRYERHSQLSNPKAQTISSCHAEWELDAQGVCKVAGVGLVSLINMGDPFSHVRASWACLNKRKASGAVALRRAFSASESL